MAVRGLNIRNEGKSVGKSYTTPPTYQDEPVPNPAADALANTPLYDASMAAVNSGPGDSGVGGSTPEQLQQMGDVGVGGVPPPTPGQPGSGVVAPTPTAPGTEQQQQQQQNPESPYDSYLKQYLDQAFGAGRSFDPIQQKMEGQRNDALRSMAENMASRGLGNSGALASGAGDIYANSQENIANAYQNWREQGVQDMGRAIAPFYENVMSKDLLGATTDEKIRTEQALSNILMDRLMGTNRDPTKGLIPFQALWEQFTKGTPSGDDLLAIENAARREWPDLMDYGSGSGSSGYPTTEQQEQNRQGEEWMASHGYSPQRIAAIKINPSGPDADMLRILLKRYGKPIPSWLQGG